MSDQPKKRNYFIANKYQNSIVYVTFIPSLIIALVITICIILYQLSLMNAVINSEVGPGIEFIKNRGAIIIVVVWVFFMSNMIWAFHVSKNLVGPFVRITRELDEIVNGKAQKKIVARPKDGLANELLKPINLLLEKSAESELVEKLNVYPRSELEDRRCN